MKRGSKMKIDLVELKINGEKSYKYKPFKYCCTKMRDNPYIDFTNENVSSEYGNFGSSHIPKFCVWEDAFERVDNFFINFCPFCGEKIEVSVVEEKDVSGTYKKLEEKKNFLRKKSGILIDKWQSYIRLLNIEKIRIKEAGSGKIWKTLVK